MAALNYDLHRTRDFLFDASQVDFKNGTVQLKLIDDLTTNIVSEITPSASPAGSGLDLISDGDPSTRFVGTFGSPTLTTITWTLGTIPVNLTRLEFTLTQDKRMWDAIIIEATDTTFTPSTTKVLYASGDDTVLTSLIGGYTAPNNIATDPNVPISTLIKDLRAPASGITLRIRIQASATATDSNNYLTNFAAYAANFSTANPRIITAQIVDTTDLTLLTETILPALPAGTATTYSIIVDGQYWWYNGFNWAKSDGSYEQSASLSTFVARLTRLLPTRNRSRVQVAFFLHTSDPNSTPTLTDLELQYDETAPSVDFPTTRLTGIIRDAFGAAIVNANVTATFVPKGNNKYTLNGVRVVNPAALLQKTSDTGFFSFDVVPTDNMTPTSGLSTDLAEWQLSISSGSYSETLKAVVPSVEEVDVFRDSWGV